MFNKTYELSLNKNYVSHWGLAEAVRELIQNALDSESPFMYEFVRGDNDDYTLILKSEFTTLSPQTLLLGSTSKRDSEDSIGSFGEGYKIALLVLTRIGKRVYVANGDKAWEPRFKYNSRFKEELLVVEESPLPFKNSGLFFEVHNLTEDEVQSIIDSCLQMQKDIGQVKTTYYGDILLDRPGMLYVGGLFICKTDLKYGYNIAPKHIKLERDRQTVSSFDLKFTTEKMWIDTKEFDHIAEMIDNDIPDVEYAQYGTPEIVKEACYRLFKKNNPGAVVAKNQDDLNRLVAQGLERVVVVNNNMYSCVSTSQQYRSETFTALETVEDRLKRWLSTNRGYMRKEGIVAFKELIKEATGWKHK